MVKQNKEEPKKKPKSDEDVRVLFIEEEAWVHVDSLVHKLRSNLIKMIVVTSTLSREEMIKTFIRSVERCGISAKEIIEQEKELEGQDDEDEDV